MHIRLITPAGQNSRAGNRATAERWSALLCQLGHRVDVSVDYDDQAADMMIALHAWRSAAAITAFDARYPDRPLIVVLTGTDIYKFQHSHPDVTLASMARADALIALHERVGQDIPAQYRPRLHLVLQSARPLAQRLPPVQSHFDVCVVGHLRAEKDSLRAALAVRDLPPESRLRVIQAGKAHDTHWHALADQELRTNPRYRWRGEISRTDVRRLMARCRLMVMSSMMEGGANAISEACVAGLPVIASRIPGNIGLLGADYPGYYPAGDTGALRALLLRAERDPDFVETLRRHCLARAPLFQPEAERASLARVIGAVTATTGVDERPSGGPCDIRG
jgi:putative glycosyltransferase (TIGR04348 family)